MEHKLLVVLDQHLVHLFHIQLGTEGNGSQALGFATGEDCAAVGAGEIVHFAPDGAHFVGLAAVQTETFVQNHIAHGLFLLVTEVAVHQGLLLLEFFLGDGGQELVADGVETILTLVLGLCALGQLQAFVVASLVNSLAQILVLYIVRVIPLDVVAKLCDELFLHAAVLLYLFVGKLDGLEHIVLADLVHFALYHHDILFCGCNHQLQVAVLHLAEGRVDPELAVNACHADLGNRAAER